MRTSICYFALLVLSFSVAFGASGPARVANAPSPSVTEHTILVAGQPLHYRATAGYLPLQDSTGKPLAQMFFVAYERLEDETVVGSRTSVVGDGTHAQNRLPTTDYRLPQNRPLTFAFNGGPGACSVWLHLGGIGPQRVPLGDEGTTLPAVDRLVDNEATWLTFTDLVFVDPVGTGFSRAAPGVEERQFYDFQRDAETDAAFIRLFVTQFGRWLSPTYLVGESYGTTRAVAMTRRLQDHDGLYVRGLILLSSALNLQVISLDAGNDLPYALALPTYAAVAQYQGVLPAPSAPDLARSLRRVQSWALTDYLALLAQGSLLSPGDARLAARRLSEYTGLPEEMVREHHLRVGPAAFSASLLSRQGRVLGLLDGRVTAPARSADSGRFSTDPALFITVGPYVAAFNRYVRADLGFATDRPYIYLSPSANDDWNWGPGRRGYLNVAPTLAESMSLDERLHVFAAAGYYDLTTPYLSQQYVFNHLNLPSDLRSHLTFHIYPTGHQIYTVPESLAQLTADAGAFVAGAQP